MNLDRNQLIGIGLIVLMFIGFTYFTPSEEVTKPKTETKISEESSPVSSPIATEIKDSAVTIDSNKVVPERVLSIENEDFSFKISSKGAKFYDFELKNYKVYDKTSQVVLLQKALTNSKILLAGTDLNGSSLNYSINKSESNLLVKGEPLKVELSAQLANGKTVVQSFIIPEKGFLIEHKIEGSALLDQSDLGFEFSNAQAVNERKFKNVEGYKFARQHSSLNYFTSEEEFEEVDGLNTDDENPEKNVAWFAFRERFFTVGVVPQNPMSNVKFLTYHGSEDADTTYIKQMSASYKVALNNDKKYYSQIYVGPNDYYILDATGIQNFGDNVDMGFLIFALINRYMILPVFEGLSHLFGDFGIVIFLLVLCIKILLFPIAYKSYQSMAKMKALKPDLDKLKAKHGDDQQAYGAAQMGLYRQAGVSPLSGCLPQLLQIPFLFALFRFFPNAIQLRQESFLWADDLSTFDGFVHWNSWVPFIGEHLSIFTILMTVTTLINTWYNSQFSSMSTGSDNPMANQMKYMMYFMPLIFFFVLNDYPSGLTYYYFLSTLFTMGQQFFANKLIDTDKLRAKIEINMKNAATGNVKKSRFQQRLESAMAAQEAAKKGK